jgi:DUF1680 family protein
MPATATITGPVSPRSATALRPAFTRITGGLFADWQQRNLDHTAPHCIEELHEYGHVGNFERMITGERRPFAGYVFADSDLHKAMEGLAWTPVGDAERDEFFDRVISLVEEVQEADGYLNTAFQGWDATQERWSDFPQGHELYSLGHLIQAGIAARRSGRGDRLLAVAQRFADLAVELFRGVGRPEVPGHPEIEMALVELYRETGERSYLDLAREFIDRRGSGWLGGKPHGPYYYQDVWPLRDTHSLYGHAVRAAYLCAGAADVAVETGDAALLDHLEVLWDDMVSTKSYITGGIGSRHRDEAFGDAYELPSERAYAETCAAIGVIQWGWRMLLATGDRKYADHVERVLLNAFAVGLGQDGRSFFYSNPLQRRADHLPSQEEGAGERLPWFDVSCCPPNILRTMATLHHYVATHTADGVQIHLPVSAEVSADLADGSVRLDITGEYPWRASFRIEVIETPRSPWTLSYRLPDGVDAVVIDGRPVVVADGVAQLSRAWEAGDIVEIHAQMPVRRLRSHPAVDATRGSSAFARGPIMLCAEEVDTRADLDAIRIPQDASAHVMIDGHSVAVSLNAVEHSGGDDLYREHSDTSTSRETALILRPYFQWGNRGIGAMRVWLPDETDGEDVRR